MKVDLPDEKGTVISFDVIRRSRYERQLCKTCPHHALLIDTALAKVQCQTCGAELNPTECLAMMVDEWGRIQRMYEHYMAAKAAVEIRSKVKCRNCGKFTPL